MKIGFSKDIHVTKKGIPLVLCGVNIPCEFGLESHSDGDCATHAIVEAIFGALNVGDLGTHYPPSDPKYKGISSMVFLEDAREILKEKGYKIGNIDLFISCEKPKLKPFIKEMVEKVAKALQISEELISIKAGTNEGVGPVGKGEAIESYCVCLVEKIDK
ncbi:MAG: 2-C-methyl-D-erythritol 2,4-cyclodiphosphate synthase [Bacilli bacterium]|nr:2-C-methyl-D-erythritol 2,4-cyclodiphosphate synthase [Bacilli bacterium]